MPLGDNKSPELWQEEKVLCAPSEGSRAVHQRMHTFLNYEHSEVTFVCLLFVLSTVHSNFLK